MEEWLMQSRRRLSWELGVLYKTTEAVTLRGGVAREFDSK